MRIFITGDTHAEIDFHKLNTKFFPEQKKLTKDDFVIIAGDFGFIWDGSNTDKYWLKWFENKNYTTLFVDGNHENFNLINAYPVEIWNGGKIHRINNSVIHLMRGQVYELNNLKYFTFGGSKSSDIAFRKENISWWKQELPSEEEYKEGILNLNKNNWNVDFVITHTSSTKILNVLEEKFKCDEEVTEIHHFLNNIENKCIFKHWYFGHFHKDDQLDEKHTVLYKKILEINQKRD